MTIARQAAKQKKVFKPKLIDVSKKKVYKAPEGNREKHFNFRPGGMYYEA